MLYLAAVRSVHLEGSAFGAYYHRLVERGRKYGSALMAVMRKMLAVAAHLLMHEEEAHGSQVRRGQPFSLDSRAFSPSLRRA
jgi:transposase